MTIDTEFESRLTTMLHDRAETAMNRLEIGAPSAVTSVRRRSRGLLLTVGAMAAVTIVGLVTISVRSGDDRLASSARPDSDWTTVTTEATTSGSILTLAQASNWLLQQCMVLRQHQIPEHMTTEDAVAICGAEVGVASLSQFGFLAEADSGDTVSNWLSAAPQALTRCLTEDRRIPVMYITIEVAAPVLVDASAEAPSDIIEGCWKSTLIALGLVDRNMGATPTDSPTLATTLGTLADVTPEQTIATTTTLG
jgi:hypothetical protein